MLPSAVGWIKFRPSCTVFSHGPMRNEGFSGGGARMPARSVCLVTLSLSEAGPGRFGGQVSVTDIYHSYHAMPCHTRRLNSVALLVPLRSVQFSSKPQALHECQRERNKRFQSSSSGVRSFFQRAPNALRATRKAFHSKSLPQLSSHDLRRRNGGFTRRRNGGS